MEEEITPKTEETPPKTETPEDLKAQLTALQAEKERFENLYKDSQRKESRIAERERKLDVLDSIPALQQEIADIKEYNETMAEFLEQRLAGEQPFPEQTFKPSPFQDLRRKQEERRKAPVEKKEPPSEVDPEELRAAVLAQGLIEEMGWNMESPAVKKTLHLDDAQEALKILRKEAKAQREKEVDESIQVKLKEAGITKSETGGPSGGKDIFSREVIAKMSDEEFAQHQKDLWQAFSEGKIK